jgi:hypothetical protein
MFERSLEACLEQASAGSGEFRDDVIVEFVFRRDVAFHQQGGPAGLQHIVDFPNELLAHADATQALADGARRGARENAENRMQKKQSDEQSRHRARSEVQGPGVDDMAESYRALIVARGDNGVGYTKDFFARQRQQRIARRFGGLRVGIANHNQVAHVAPSRSRAAMGALGHIKRRERGTIDRLRIAVVADRTLIRPGYAGPPSPAGGRRKKHPRRGRRVHLTSGLHT